MENKRNYEKKKIKSNLRYSNRMIKGLKKVHIGENVWLIGKSARIKDGRLHQVIYGPENKEYHLYDNDVKFVNHVPESEDYSGRSVSYVNRHGNSSYEPMVKIYILTHILDAKENWCFDLNIKPKQGTRVKVVYDNGTVKWVESFTGEFEKAELVSKAIHPVAIYTGDYWQQKYKEINKQLKPGQVFEMKDQPIRRTYVNPIAYRII